MAFDITIKEYLKEIDESPLLNWEEEKYLASLIIEEQDPVGVLVIAVQDVFIQYLD